MCATNKLCPKKGSDNCTCARWYQQLDDEGLGDLDVNVRGEPDLLAVSNKGSGKMDDDLDLQGRQHSEELAEEARDILRHHDFPTNRDGEIWTLHVDGKSIRDVAKILGISFRQTKKSIDATRAAWRAQQRAPIKLTKTLVEQADPDFLLDLLDAATVRGRS